MVNDSISEREVLTELLRRKAQKDLLAFLQWVWWMPRPLKIGRHTRALCARLTQAVDDFLAGKSTYLIVSMPFRHGKSDIVSRALPAFFLGRCAAEQPDVIMSGYGTSLVKGFSKKVQTIVRDKAYQQLFPGIEPSKVFHAAEEWQIDGSAGTIVAQGLGGAITGKGGNLIIVDDYCKNREEAESETLRNKTWESFSDDLMTRTNAPAAIVIVCATRWHIDDIIGRIKEAKAKDPDYPDFEELIFPARKAGEYATLFPELYDEGWYKRQRAQLGSYSAAALLDCEPVGDQMRLFKDEWWHEYGKDGLPPLQTMNIVVLIDPADSQKQNADFTTMWVLGFAPDGNVYTIDIIHDKLKLKGRTDKVFELHRAYNPLATAYESYGLDGDTQHIELEQERYHYHFPIVRLKHTKQKDVRIMRLQPWFEMGKFWFPAQLMHQRADGSWYDAIEEFRDEFKNYPAGKHDDMLDSLSDIFDPELKNICRFPETNEHRQAAAQGRQQRSTYARGRNLFAAGF